MTAVLGYAFTAEFIQCLLYIMYLNRERYFDWFIFKSLSDIFRFYDAKIRNKVEKRCAMQMRISNIKLIFQ